MHFSVYLPDELVEKINIFSQERHLNRSLLIRHILEEWIKQQNSKTWPPNFFSFEAIPETPDFSATRKELSEPKEWF